MSDGILESGTILEGRYGVVRELSVGSSNRVYEGRQLNLGTSIIIKTPREIYPDPIQAKQQIEHMQLEAHLLAGLSHPNLLTVYDVFVYQELPVMICEYVEGRRLSEVVELAPKAISAKRVLMWVQQLLDGLFYLHSQDPPVIVRDLCPSNIMLGKDGRLRFIDFGLVKRMGPKGAGTHQIVKGLGAQGYAPLEQTAYSPTGPASDIYSLGATTYFVLTKTPPTAAALRIIASKDPLIDPRTLNESVSDELWDVLKRFMAVRASERPQSVSEAKKLLQSIDPERARPKGRCCVDCGKPLDLISRQGVEIDQCSKCGGIWLDRNELESLIELAVGDSSRAAELADAPTIKLGPNSANGATEQNPIRLFLRDVLERVGLG